MNDVSEIVGDDISSSSDDEGGHVCTTCISIQINTKCDLICKNLEQSRKPIFLV